MTRTTSLGVFCGSRNGADPRFAAAARVLGEAMAAQEITLVYGGGGVGLMGVVADAVLGAGGTAVGVIPDFLVAREAGHARLTEQVVVGDMHTRKAAMFARADAFVVLPGGIGTLDETLEIATWKQLGLHDKPIYLLDVAGYWSRLQALLEAVVVSGFAEPSMLNLITLVDGVETLFEVLDSPRR